MKYLIFLLLPLLVLTSCKKSMTENDFIAKVESEKKSGIRNDSLFLGYYLGMTKEDFFKLSWALNKEKLIREGISNMSVAHRPDGFESPVTMLFYPGFYNNKINVMPVKFIYDNWGPLKKEYWSNKLIFDAAKYFNRIWGAEFKLIDSEKYGKTLQSVKNNRYIRMRLEDESTVQVDIFDTMTKIDSTIYQ